MLLIFFFFHSCSCITKAWCHVSQNEEAKKKRRNNINKNRSTNLGHLTLLMVCNHIIFYCTLAIDLAPVIVKLNINNANQADQKFCLLHTIKSIFFLGKWNFLLYLF